VLGFYFSFVMEPELKFHYVSWGSSIESMSPYPNPILMWSTIYDSISKAPLTMTYINENNVCFHASCLLNLYFSNLKMEATCSSETSVDTQRTTRSYIPEDGTLHNDRCEDLKSDKTMYVFLFVSSYFFLLHVLLHVIIAMKMDWE
jgi:hypothetical protein